MGPFLPAVLPFGTWLQFLWSETFWIAALGVGFLGLIGFLRWRARRFKDLRHRVLQDLKELGLKAVEGESETLEGTLGELPVHVDVEPQSYRERHLQVHYQVDGDIAPGLFRRESRWHRLAKKVGLVREVQSGVPSFDDSVFVRGDGRFFEVIVNDPELRDSIRVLVEDHDARIDLGSDEVTVKFPGTLSAMRSLDRSKLQRMLDPVQQCLTAFERVLTERLPDLSEDEKAHWFASRVFLYGYCVLTTVLLGGGTIIMFWADTYRTLTWNLHLWGHGLGAMLGVVSVVLLYFFVRGSSASLLVFQLVAINLVIGVPVWTWGGLIVTNSVLDHRPVQRVPMEVPEFRLGSGKCGLDLRVAFRGVRGSASVTVSNQEAKRIQNGARVLAEVRPGYWGEPWLSGVTVEAPDSL